MAKLTGPLLSLDAHGTIGKSLTYGTLKGVAWLRRWVRKKYARSASQGIQRELFKRMLEKWLHMSAEEQFLWEMATRNYTDYFSHLKKYMGRWARCLYAHQTLLTKRFKWRGSPFPPNLEQMFAKDQIEGYDQIISDIETLVDMNYCGKPDPFFFQYLGDPDILGIRESYGIAIAIKEPAYQEMDAWHKKQLVAHELTHCIINQHRDLKSEYYPDTETICDEVGDRVADGNLTPVYTFNGKTLSEMVNDPTCGWYNYLKAEGYFD